MPAKPRKPGVSTIVAAVAAGDFETALEAALVVWRSVRDPALADLIDAIAARCRPPAIAGRESARFHAAWLSLAESGPRAVAIGALAAGVNKRVPFLEVAWSTPDRDLARAEPLLARVAALAALPDDPRISSALVAVVERAPYNDRRLYTPMLAVIARTADPRAATRLRALAERPTAKASTIRLYFAEALPAIVADFASPAALAATDKTIVTRLLAELAGARPAPPRRDIGELHAECLAHPDDDGPRAVLADALIERDDPRGELIALQLRDPDGSDPEVVRRTLALLRTHEKTWLGDLARVTQHRRWRRGFLDEAELKGHAVADEATWKRVSADPQLATVRALWKGRGTAALYRMFVQAPALRSLREVTIPNLTLLDEVISSGRRLDHLVLEIGLTRAVIAKLDTIADVTGATRLTFSTGESVERTIARVAAIGARHRFAQLVAAPSQIALFRLGWDIDGRQWLDAHAQLGVDRLGVARGARVIATRGKRAPQLEIVTDSDEVAAWTLDWVGPFEHLTLSGPFSNQQVRPKLTERLAKLPPGTVTLTEGWARLAVIDRGRARRARRP